MNKMEYKECSSSCSKSNCFLNLFVNSIEVSVVTFLISSLSECFLIEAIHSSCEILRHRITTSIELHRIAFFGEL